MKKETNKKLTFSLATSKSSTFAALSTAEMISALQQRNISKLISNITLSIKMQLVLIAKTPLKNIIFSP